MNRWLSAITNGLLEPSQPNYVWHTKKRWHGEAQQEFLSSLNQKNTPAMELTEIELKDLRYHETATLSESTSDDRSVTRVPGGFVYYVLGAAAFVPYTDEAASFLPQKVYRKSAQEGLKARLDPSISGP